MAPTTPSPPPPLSRSASSRYPTLKTSVPPPVILQPLCLLCTGELRLFPSLSNRRVTTCVATAIFSKYLAEPQRSLDSLAPSSQCGIFNLIKTRLSTSITHSPDSGTPHRRGPRSA
eukprot:3107433-Rhodomonas_salina.3